MSVNTQKTSRIEFKDGRNELEVMVTNGAEVTVKVISHRVDQRDSDGPFKCSVEEFWTILDEVQKAMPKRPVMRDRTNANGAAMEHYGENL